MAMEHIKQVVPLRLNWLKYQQHKAIAIFISINYKMQRYTLLCFLATGAVPAVKEQ